MHILQEFVGGKGVNMIIELVADVNMDTDVKLLAKFGRIMVSQQSCYAAGLSYGAAIVYS